MRFLRLVLLVALLAASTFAALPAPALAAAPAAPAAPNIAAGSCAKGTDPSGAITLICMPLAWNGDLVVYAHGYTPVFQPLDLQNLNLPDGTPLPSLVTGLGFAFAATSYRVNGLAVLQGVQDVIQLTQDFQAAVRKPAHTYLVGVSEGGLVTTLGVEQYPNVFSGGLATCGPIGDFQRQINYFGDFRVLFDYFYPNVLPPSPINIPPAVIANYQSTYVPAIEGALAANPGNAGQLIRTGQAAIDPANPAVTTAETAVNVLGYNVYSTDDALVKLGGNPFDNTRRWYFGSNNDFLLNAKVQRFAESPIAAANMVNYQTSGRLTRPLVTLHTTLDPVVPYWNELLYALKARPVGGGSLTPIPIFRYGHCAFTGPEVLAAFGVLVYQVTGQVPAGLPLQFNVAQTRADFARTQREMALPK